MQLHQNQELKKRLSTNSCLQMFLIIVIRINYKQMIHVLTLLVLNKYFMLDTKILEKKYLKKILEKLVLNQPFYEFQSLCQAVNSGLDVKCIVLIVCIEQGTAYKLLEPCYICIMNRQKYSNHHFKVNKQS